MKNIIIIIILLIIAVGLWLFMISKEQDTILNEVSDAEVSENTSTIDERLPEGDVVFLTKTSAGLTQPNESSDPVAIDTENTFITFTGYKVGGEHTGSFDSMQAELIVNEGVIKGGSITIDATSVKTDTAAVDTHLQSPDFFDAAQYPTISFIARDIMVNDAEQSATLKGAITLHGVTKDISVPITLLANGIAADFSISMKEFGIEYIATKDEVRVQAQIVLK